MFQGKVVSNTSKGFLSIFNLKSAFDLTKTPSRFKKVSRKVEMVELLIFSQLLITLLSNVYLPVASLHQTNSILLLSTLLISYHQIKIRKVKNV